MEDALRSFEAVLKERPTNLIALLGKARLVLVAGACADNFGIGEDTICATSIHPCSQIVPTSATTEPILSSGSPHWDGLMSMGTES